MVIEATRSVGETVELRQSRSLPTASMRCQQLVDVERDGDLADRVGELAVLDPEARRAAREVAGHGVEAEAHHLGDVEAALGAVDDLRRLRRRRLEDEVRRRAPDAAARRRATALPVEARPSLRAL